MTDKKPLWQRRMEESEGGGKRSALPVTGTSPAPMTTEFRNSINLMILDEKKGIKEYEVLIARARNLGADDVVKTLEEINNDERWHAEWLQEISDGLYKFLTSPG